MQESGRSLPEGPPQLPALELGCYPEPAHLRGPGGGRQLQSKDQGDGLLCVSPRDLQGQSALQKAGTWCWRSRLPAHLGPVPGLSPPPHLPLGAENFCKCHGNHPRNGAPCQPTGLVLPPEDSCSFAGHHGTSPHVARSGSPFCPEPQACVCSLPAGHVCSHCISDAIRLAPCTCVLSPPHPPPSAWPCFIPPYMRVLSFQGAPITHMLILPSAISKSAVPRRSA